MYRKMIYLVSFILVLSIASNTSAELVAYWKFDEVSGTIAHDSSGNGLDGTLRGNPRWVAGKIGGALDFDGAGDYVDCGNSKLFDIVDEITVSAWIYMRSVRGEWRAIIAKGDSAWRLSTEASTQRMHFSFTGGGRGWLRVDSVTWIPFNEWHHVCGVYDRRNGGRIYIDGVKEAVNRNTGGIDVDTFNVFIGENSEIRGRYWDGLIDDVQVYNHALTEDEILDIIEGDMATTRNINYVDANATGNNDGSSWANAYVYLQDALADANDAQKPVEIRVAQGTYTPDCGNGYVRGDKSCKFLLKSGVTLKGGFAGAGTDDPNDWDHKRYKTVLSGDLSGNDERLLDNFVENSDHVIWCIEEDASAVLDGFTITGGYATDRVGGGLLNYNANPTVIRCVFFDNYASQGGGMANRHSNPRVTDCTFDGNLAPHGGGGMYNDYGHPIVESCVFYDNWTWYLGGGGMYCGGDDPTITNCLFTNNRAPFGGGMYNAAANPTLINCTFSNNQGGAWGGGMQNDAGSNPTVTNCILWGDTPDEISFSGTGTVTYSNVQGGWPGIGNMDRDPKFADHEGRLSASSPCIDVGNNDAVSSDITTDLDGDPRITNGTVDMGAHEFGGTVPSPTPGPSADSLVEALDTTLSFTTGGDENWFSQSATYYHDGDAAQSGSITDDQESWMQTSVNGAGTVSFHWMVSSEGNYDCLEFYIDDTLQDKISGSEDWHNMTYEISGSGLHTLEWRYFKDGSMSSGDDCGRVDYVEWVPAP